MLEEAENNLEENVENSVNLFTRLMRRTCKPMEYILDLSKKKKDRKPWFDRECEQKRKEIITLLKKLNRINSTKHPERYQKAKTDYLNKR